ncbi:hypothetical protein LOTGIDRAFT_224293 [Lottia gigantea]|uniref:Uncharacterized protein n=1 Tax=Lottia gigantea TaxID=225164 RepID=V4B0J6_LOTGI|nr:hypothetical protein LOTGIDRAFT_224293 [Lottia gigantea]ESP03633.1 hypothetical protein LOTGIDRAFT_224293 [Lottia gigantea]
MEETSTHYIELCPNPIRFEPVGKANNVFFDDANRQVFAVRSGGAMGVVVKGPDDKSVIQFRMESRGDVMSIKFSPDKKILAVQRSFKSVEFVNFLDDMTTDELEYSQTCKGKSTQIISFLWTGLYEIIFITNHGLEQYQIYPEKRTLKCLKTISLQVNWVVCMPENGILLLSSGSTGNTLHPVQVRPGVLNKLPKFEVDLPAAPKSNKVSLVERDVTLANIYNQLYIVVLRHQPSANVGAEIVLYQLQKESPARKSDVLKLDMSGRFAINIVDNLVMVHHQASKTSVIFDIQQSSESDGFIKYHYPVLSPLPIKPFKLLLPSKFTLLLPYSANWIVFQPDIVIDAKLGCLWYIKINLEPLVTMIYEKTTLISFLLKRKESKMVILSVCQKMLIPGQQANLHTIATVYDMLNTVFKSYRDTEAQVNNGELPHNVLNSWKKKVIIDQSDMFTHVFSVYEDCKDIKYKFMVAVLIEYIRSLNQFNMAVQHYLYELIINILVNNKCFYQLHQFLQYHVLSDSKPLACLMLSLESVYQPAHQLALDMLKRLQTANEEIIEVLLSKQQLLQALRFIRSVGIVDTVSSRKFLEAGLNTNDDMLFYTVFKFFEARNLRLRSNPRFQQGEHCELYVKHFESVFGIEALAAVPVS